MKVTQKVNTHVKAKELQRNISRKNLCIKEDISSSDAYEISDSETWRVLFMEVRFSNREDFEE